MNKGTELTGKIGHIDNIMEKEFEALDDLFDLVHSQESFEKGQKCYNILKDALIELKTIKEADLNKALEYMKSLFECWKNLAEKDNLETKDIELEKYIFKENYDAIKQYILKAKENEKILSTIKAKRIDIESFYTMFVECNLDYDYYETFYENFGLQQLTEEEFDELKEWLRCKEN